MVFPVWALYKFTETVWKVGKVDYMVTRPNSLVNFNYLDNVVLQWPPPKGSKTGKLQKCTATIEMFHGNSLFNIKT